MEDVADNMVSSQLARGEKESMVIRALCETLSKTGSSSEIVATTMMSALKRVLSETKSDCDIMKAIGNTMHEQGTESEYKFTYTMQSFRKELRKYSNLSNGREGWNKRGGGEKNCKINKRGGWDFLEKNKCITAIDEKRRVKNIKEINKRGGWIFFFKNNKRYFTFIRNMREFYFGRGYT